MTLIPHCFRFALVLAIGFVFLFFKYKTALFVINPCDFISSGLVLTPLIFLDVHFKKIRVWFFHSTSSSTHITYIWWRWRHLVGSLPFSLGEAHPEGPCSRIESLKYLRCSVEARVSDVTQVEMSRFVSKT